MHSDFLERDTPAANAHGAAPAPEQPEAGAPGGKLRRIFSKLVNRETLLYGVFGVLTTLLNLGLFRLLLACGLDYKPANIVTLVVVKLAAYVLNKIFVFRSRTESFWLLCKEFLRYLATRGFTMLVDYFGLILLVDALGMREMPGKCVTTAVVVILNYFLGKFLVFTGKKPDADRVG